MKVELWDRDGVPLRYAELPVKRHERVVKIPIKNKLTAAVLTAVGAPPIWPIWTVTYLRVNPGKAGVPIFQEQA